jgi:hypothetical protein
MVKPPFFCMSNSSAWPDAASKDVIFSMPPLDVPQAGFGEG